MIPLGGHTDWLFGLLKFVKRSWTAKAGPPPTHVIFSDNFDHAHKNPDVPNEGAWTLSTHPEYGVSFAWAVDGWLLSVGSFRYDYADGYYTFPRFAFKRLKK